MIKIKILICVGTLSSGGAERVVSNLANYFAKTDDIKVISFYNTDIAYEFDKKISIAFLDDTKSPKNKIIKNIKRLFKLNTQINNFKPDIILSFIPGPCFFTLLLKKFNKIPVIISVRNDPKVEYKSKLNNFLMRKLYPLADGIIFQTEEAKEYFNGILKCRQEIIPNPINESFIMPIFNGVRKKEIVNVGRLQEQKNQAMLIKAFKIIEDKIPDYKLVIYGNGILKDKLLELIKQLNLEKKVILAGVSKNIRDEIYDSSLFVLSSNYEGMPNALMEAMTLGLPVISTDCPCGGPRFLITNNENGLLVPVNDVEALAKSILRVLSDESLSFKLQTNAKKIIDDLAPSKINGLWREFIQEIYVKKKGETNEIK